MSTAKIPGLDLLRSLAILLVFLWHYQKTSEFAAFNQITRYGWTGVDLFFVLSGYLIAGQLFRPMTNGDRPHLCAFYIKRAFRILPAYFAVLVLYFTSSAWNESNGLQPLWRFLTFTMNFGLDRGGTGGFSHAWSLCVEEHFYLIFPLLVFGVWKLRKYVSLKVMTVSIPIGLIVFGMCLRAKLWLAYVGPRLVEAPQINIGRLYDKIIYYPSYTRLDGLLVGILLAQIFTFRPELKNKLAKHPNRGFVAGMVLFGLGCMAAQERTSLVAAVLSFPLFAFAFGGLVASAALPNSWLNRRPMPGAATLAALAYSFYLTHKEIIHLLRSGFTPYEIIENDELKMLFAFSLCLAAAALLYVAVERPFLRIRQRLYGF